MTEHAYDEIGLPSVGPNIHARITEKWYRADNLRLCATRADDSWKERYRLIRAVVLEYVKVDTDHRRQGLCRALIESMKELPGFEMVVVEGVGNANLFAALVRWGWEYDAGVKDFYWKLVAA